MPSGGQNRLPDHLKALKGTLRPCRVNEAAPEFVFKPIPSSPPAALGLREDEVRVWRRLRLAVNRLRVTSADDVESFALLVMSVSLAHAVARNPKASPHERTNAIRAARAALSEFGLSPSSRSRVKSARDPKEEEEDPLAGIVN